MRINLPPDTSLHVASGLEISMRGDGVHVRPRHRTKLAAVSVLSVLLAGSGGWVWGSWDRMVAESVADAGPDPASMQVLPSRPPGPGAGPGVQSAAAARPAPTVVQPPLPAAARQSDPFGLTD